MQVVYRRCCGLDVHKKTVVACVLITQEDGTVERQLRTFGTMTSDLLSLSDWLDRRGVTHIALESTGVYWQPVYNILEAEARTIVLVNAQHIKATSVHYPHWEHERIDGHGHGHGSGPSAVWAELIAAGDHP